MQFEKFIVATGLHGLEINVDQINDSKKRDIYSEIFMAREPPTIP